MLAASVSDIANRPPRSTAVLEYGPTETPTLLGPTLLGFARLCRQLPPGMVRIMAENPGFALERTRNPERDGLSAGGSWIRTFSSPTHASHFIENRGFGGLASTSS